MTTNITQSSISGTATPTSGASDARVTTIRVAPGSARKWINVELKGTFPDLSKINVSLYSCTTPAPTPIAGYQNMALPLSKKIDISTLPVATYPCIHARVNILAGSPAPILDDVIVRWNPLPVSKISLSGSTSASVGTDMRYEINYSNSFVDDTDVVVWAPLPAALTDSYGRTVNFEFVRTLPASGLYTATSLTIGTTTIPANSVYWHFDEVKSGDTMKLVFFIKSKNGEQNGLNFTMQAHIDGEL